MKIIAVVLIAVAAGTVAACGTASTVTVAASPAAVPAGQPGASPPPSAACLKAGNCTVSQQQQVATSEGITNPGGLNGCLVAGDCTASQQKGIAAGTSAGDSSSSAPPSSSAASGSGFTASCVIAPQYGVTGNSDPNIPSSTVLMGFDPMVTFTNATGTDESVDGSEVTVIYFDQNGDQIGTGTVQAPAVIAANQAVTTGTGDVRGYAPTGTASCSVAPYQTSP